MKGKIKQSLFVNKTELEFVALNKVLPNLHWIDEPLTCDVTGWRRSPWSKNRAVCLETFEMEINGMEYKKHTFDTDQATRGAIETTFM